MSRSVGVLRITGQFETATVDLILADERDKAQRRNGAILEALTARELQGGPPDGFTKVHPPSMPELTAVGTNARCGR